MAKASSTNEQLSLIRAKLDTLEARFDELETMMLDSFKEMVRRVEDGSGKK